MVLGLTYVEIPATLIWKFFFILIVGAECGNWNLYDTVSANQTSYTDNHTSPFTDYEYQVRAIAPGASSDPVIIGAYTGPIVSDTLATAYTNSPNIAYYSGNTISESRIHVVYADNRNIYWMMYGIYLWWQESFPFGGYSGL